MCQLHECLSLSWELEKKCFFTWLYGFPSQTFDEFEDFCTELKLFLSNISDLNPACSVITGDFNARSPQWWALDQKNYKGHEISFTSNPSFITESAVELLLYEKYHHNLIYRKINFNVSHLPPYIREVWDYKNAKVDNIQLSVSGSNWDLIFQAKILNQKVNIFNECFLNVFHNFIPSKKIKSNYKNGKKNTDLDKALLN